MVMGNTNKVLTALGVGLAAGAILGVLFAPGKGTDTREKIARKGRQLADDISDSVAEGQRKFNAIKDGLMERKNNLERKLDEVV